MTRITQTLSLITALLSGSIYDTAEARPQNSIETSSQMVRGIDSSEEDLRIMAEARIALGTELSKR
ncbi:hypothetical protein [Allorhodopirellula solitaria]|uniref:Uncharacterized protein n=1 Tax=Allorhodopirellula solitaria TaxID=2527987 RepID=A0A5C5YK84_9BACT|nr:hypothetical protein [Allorhodopirellula solitaria]TWT75326.1 hypothetical protein CA85_06170 [Allorhodopirellula solitaria]